MTAVWGRLARLLVLLALPCGVMAAPKEVGRLALDDLPGGLSAIDTDGQGQGFVMLTDRGGLIQGVLRRQGGRISGLGAVSRLPLRGPDGAALSAPANDSEGVTLAPGGGFYVAYERDHRVWKHNADGSFAAALPPLPIAPYMRANGGLEALASQGDRLYTLPERWPGDRTPLLRHSGAGWQITTDMSKDYSYWPVGADIGPDGALYVLERAYLGVAFSSRVRRLSAQKSGVETLWESAAGAYGNLEGLAVWRDGSGAIRLLMVSDNNEKPGKRSWLIELRL